MSPNRVKNARDLVRTGRSASTLPPVEDSRELFSITIGPGRITASGEIDAWTAPVVAASIAAHAGSVTLDLTGTSFIDSSGVSCLVEHTRNLERDGGRLTIVPSAAVRRIVELAGLGEAVHLIVDDGGG